MAAGGWAGPVDMGHVRTTGVPGCIPVLSPAAPARVTHLTWLTPNRLNKPARRINHSIKRPLTLRGGGE